MISKIKSKASALGSKMAKYKPSKRSVLKKVAKTKKFVKKNKTAIAAGGVAGVGGLTIGSISGSKKERKKAIGAIQKMGIAKAAKDLGIRKPASKLTMDEKRRILKKAKKTASENVNTYTNFFK